MRVPITTGMRVPITTGMRVAITTGPEDSNWHPGFIVFQIVKLRLLTIFDKIPDFQKILRGRDLSCWILAIYIHILTPVKHIEMVEFKGWMIVPPCTGIYSFENSPGLLELRKFQG